MHGFRIGGIGIGTLHAARRGTVAPGDDGARSLGGLVENLFGRTAGNGAVAGIAQGYGTFDNHNVFAPVGFHGAVAHGFGLEAAGRHEGVGVVERNHLEQNLPHERMRRAQKRLAAAGALLKVKPEYRFAGLGLQGIDHLGQTALLQSQHGSHDAAEFEKLAAGITLRLQLLVECFFFSHDR